MTKSRTAARAATTAAPVGAVAGADDDASQSTTAADSGAGAADTGAGSDPAGTGAADTGSHDGGSVGHVDATAAQTDAVRPASAESPQRMRAVVLFSGGPLSQPVGSVIEGPVDLVDRLQIAGDVDSHPSAVEAALAGGATPVSVE